MQMRNIHKSPIPQKKKDLGKKRHTEIQLQLLKGDIQLPDINAPRELKNNLQSNNGTVMAQKRHFSLD